MTSGKTWACLEQPGGCSCRCHAVSTGMARSKKTKRSLWTPQRDDELRRLLREGVTQRVIADRLGVSISTVRHRRQALGISGRDGWRSEFEVGRALGVSWRYTRRWRTDGLLRADQHEGSTWWRISEAALEAFVRAHAGGAVDVRRITDARLRSIAEVSAVANSRRGVEAAR